MGWMRTKVVLVSAFLLVAILTQIAIPVDMNQFLTVITVCGLVTDVSTQSFGAVPVGVTSAETQIRVNNTGSVSANVNLTGSDWWNASETMDVGVTHYNYTDAAQDYDDEMWPLDKTNQTIGSIANGGSKLVYFKVKIPALQETAVYRQETMYSTVC